MTAVVLKRPGLNGHLIETVDPCGGVFANIPGRPMRPVWALGPKDAKVKSDLMFTCPVSAIPAMAWDLLALWQNCRLMKLPPVAGGFVDQPLMVQRSFPIFEQEQERRQRVAGAAGGAETAALAAGAALKAVFGGR